MRKTNYYLYLTPEQYRLIFHSLIDFKNKLLEQGKYVDAVDEVIIKISSGR